MPLGYSKDQFASILQDIIYIITLQLAFLSLEIDSKYGIELSVTDQDKLDLFISRYKTFMILLVLWIVATCGYFLYRYGMGGFLMYLLVSILLFGYVAISYDRMLKRICLKCKLKMK